MPWIFYDLLKKSNIFLSLSSHACVCSDCCADWQAFVILGPTNHTFKGPNRYTPDVWLNRHMKCWGRNRRWIIQLNMSYPVELSWATQLQWLYSHTRTPTHSYTQPETRWSYCWTVAAGFHLQAYRKMWYILSDLAQHTASLSKVLALWQAQLHATVAGNCWFAIIQIWSIFHAH